MSLTLPASRDGLKKAEKKKREQGLKISFGCRFMWEKPPAEAAGAVKTGLVVQVLDDSKIEERVVDWAGSRVRSPPRGQPHRRESSQRGTHPTSWGTCGGSIAERV